MKACESSYRKPVASMFWILVSIQLRFIRVGQLNPIVKHYLHPINNKYIDIYDLLFFPVLE